MTKPQYRRTANKEWVDSVTLLDPPHPYFSNFLHSVKVMLKKQKKQKGLLTKTISFAVVILHKHT